MCRTPDAFVLCDGWSFSDCGDGILVRDPDASVDRAEGRGGCSCSLQGRATPFDACLWLALLALLRRRRIA